MRKPALSHAVSFALSFCAAVALACQDGGRGPTAPGPVFVAAEASAASSNPLPGRAARGGLREEVERPRLAGSPAALRAERQGTPSRLTQTPADNPDLSPEALDARGGNGNGGGNGGGNRGGNGGGNGNGGNRGGRGGDDIFAPSRLTLQITPDHWNVNYEHAGGHVTAFVRGPGLGAIDRGSIELLGDDPAATPVPARSARIEGSHLRAQFPKSEVLALLGDPTPGTTHTVILRFTAEGVTGPVELTDQIVVVGPPGDGGGGGETPGEIQLAVQVQPQAWNINWEGSAGTVSFKITGPGFRRIDLDSIVLVGTDPAAGEIEPRRTQRAGSHVRTLFGKAEAFSALLDPAPGQVHTVTLKFTVEGEAQELTAEVRVVGPAR